MNTPFALLQRPEVTWIQLLPVLILWAGTVEFIIYLIRERKKGGATWANTLCLTSVSLGLVGSGLFMLRWLLKA